MDDNLDTVKERLKVYYDQTHVLKEYYDKLNLRVSIDGSRPLKEITENVVKALNKKS